jgi:hypothetical protein
MGRSEGTARSGDTGNWGAAQPGPDRCPRRPLQVGRSADGQDGTRRARFDPEKDAPCPWRPHLVCNWTPLMRPPTDHGLMWHVQRQPFL